MKAKLTCCGLLDDIDERYFIRNYDAENGVRITSFKCVHCGRVEAFMVENDETDSIQKKIDFERTLGRDVIELARQKKEIMNKLKRKYLNSKSEINNG